MVRPEKEDSVIIRNQFTENNDKSFSCKHCNKLLKNSSTFNLKRHIVVNHVTLADELQLCSQSEIGEPSTKKVKKISIKLDKQTYVQACVKLTTQHNFPLSLLDCEGFRDIVTPIESALNITINRSNIKNQITTTYELFKAEIINEVKNKLINVKIDSATVQSRSIVGINIQFIKNDAITIRSIGMVEMKIKQTGLNLTNVVLNELLQFGITQD